LKRYKDRLLRLGAEGVWTDTTIYEAKNGEVVILIPGEATIFTNDWDQDVLR
jgi:hypothetical protein